ncbi:MULTISPECIES: polysaccharide biosynthesis/export family protein [Methylomonas]|uniref:polysaccharide biosynthesis/export family protein n=1 Tax=Methylomonas TaxID=416 RepID=UPI0012324AC1|nr:polysaccharide biosynthesis/export family protein [Methylomonas rhizoryzae]
MRKPTKLLPLLLITSACSQYDNIPVFQQTVPEPDAQALGAQAEQAEGIISGQAGQSPVPENLPASEPVELSEFPLEDNRYQGQLRLRVGDSVKFMVWGYPELAHVAEVQANGGVTLPLVGEVAAKGRTVEDIRNDATQLIDELSRKQYDNFQYEDSLTLFVWQHDDLKITDVVKPDGTVTFPLAGKIQVVGRSIDEIESDVRNRLKQYIYDPRVSIVPKLTRRNIVSNPLVSILPQDLKPRQVAVIGEVMVQGQKPIASGTRVMDALAASQIKVTGDMDSVVIIRNIDSKHPQYRRLKLSEYMEGTAPEQNIFLHENDVIILPKTKIAEVGQFVNDFFTSTKPILEWYIASQQTFYINDILRLSTEATKAAIRAYNQSTVNPTLPSPPSP